MGVHGLTTYLREHTRSISHTIRFPLTPKNPVSIVVDGWSFIYRVYQDSKLPWVYGGEYPDFSGSVARVLEAWTGMGLRIYVVFDGACPDLKFPTIITRLGQSHVQPALLFFRTSVNSRTTARFLHETRILPPLSYDTCVHALEDLAKKNDAIKVHYADEEGDPYAVELAGRVDGYVVGNDSDFVILNAPGYLGYISFDDMRWESAILEQALQPDDPSDDFRTVSKSKSKKKREIFTGILPPGEAQDLQLTCTVYHPDALASHLRVPVTLLPLLSALVGNDFTHQSESDRRSTQSQFFEKKLTVVQRIEHAAAAMRNALSPATLKKKSKHQIGSVMDLIDRTVNVLLAHLFTPLSSSEVDKIVDKVVTAALQYAITKTEGNALWPTNFCALHEPDLCSLLPPMSRRVLEESRGAGGQTPALMQSATIRQYYVRAYRAGSFSPKMMDVLNTGTSWPRLFLENPDLETVSRSITRPLRIWIYSILDDSLGLSIAEEDASETDGTTENRVSEDEIRSDEEGDELIDVVESDSEEERVDFLGPLKGELQRLHVSDDDTTETDGPLSVSSQRSNRVGNPKVTEHVRRGTRIAAEVVHIIPLADLLSSISYVIPSVSPDADEMISLIQQPVEERFTVFLRILESDLPSVRNLQPESLQPVLAARWIARCLYFRALETGSRDREQEKWSSHEAKCFFAAMASCAPDPTECVGNEYPPVRDRNVQLTAQLLAALEAVGHLAQVLLITPLVPPAAHRFQGKLFHSYLAGTQTFPENEIIDEVWQACRENLTKAFKEDRVKKEHQVRKLRDPATASAQKKMKAGSKGGFLLLAGLDIQ